MNPLDIRGVSHAREMAHALRAPRERAARWPLVSFVVVLALILVLA